MKKYAIKMKVIIIAKGNTPEEITKRVIQAFNKTNIQLPADEIIEMRPDGEVETEEVQQ